MEFESMRTMRNLRAGEKYDSTSLYSLKYNDEDTTRKDTSRMLYRYNLLV